MGKVEGGVYESIFSERRVVIKKVELLQSNRGNKWVGWVEDGKYIPLRTIEANYRRV